MTFGPTLTPRRCRAYALRVPGPWWFCVALGVNALCKPCQGGDPEQGLTASPAWIHRGPVPRPSLESVTPFRRYHSAENGFSLEVPVGWRGDDAPGRANFSDGRSGIRVRAVLRNGNAGLSTLFGAAQTEAQGFGGPVVVRRVEEVWVPAGQATLVKFRVGSLEAPEGRVVQPLDCAVYLFRRPGGVCAITLWAPAASGYRELWRRLLASLRWT